jgi:hypothetical protein
MKVDAKRLLDRLRDRTDRKRKSIYVSEGVYEDFEKSCGEVPVSRVLEELMIQFIESEKKEQG